MKKTGLKRQDGDKFYTKKLVVDQCMKAVIEKIDLDDLLLIEPSAGDGAFIDAIKQSTAMHRFYDIEPHHPDIIKCDFLETDISDDTTPICFIGNPPFGRQSSLAIKFIKKCCAIGDFVCFILPSSFKKQSMQKHFPLKFHLLHQCDIQEHGFTVDGSSHNVPCVFQIWKKYDTDREVITKQEPVGFVFVKKEENPDVAFRRVGVNAGNIYTTIDDKSEQSHYFIKFNQELDNYSCIESMKKLVFPSDNTVGPKSISKQELISKLNGKL
ncbi:MAG: hypothetical protein ACXABD_04960 [Candidatus Thorarchaeota archaeon]|jgi:hypothetical protein